MAGVFAFGTGNCGVPWGFFPFDITWECSLLNETAEAHLPVPARSVAVTYPARMHLWGDVDFGDHVCEFEGPMDWPKLRDVTWRVVQAHMPETTVSPEHLLVACELQGFELPPLWGVFSDERNDCYFGALSHTLSGFLCALSDWRSADAAAQAAAGSEAEGAVRAHADAKEAVLWGWWVAVCMEVEAFFFYLKVPLLAAAASAWPVFELFDAVSRAARSLARPGKRKTCFSKFLKYY